MIKIKRAYEEPNETDGKRVLVERLWPRGLTKERAAIDIWLKDISPSPGLRKWYSHEGSKWEEFRRRYWSELQGNEPTIEVLMDIVSKGDVTFIFAAKDPDHSSAVVLKEFIGSKLKRIKKRPK